MNNAVFLIAIAAFAQDTRNVVEPQIPPVCTTLIASQFSKNLVENQPDTQRIQKALDDCKPGQAVRLTADAAHDAFLSGPLELRAGVTLLIDANTTLFASMNPRDYDVSPGKCGIVDQSGRGCQPLIGGNGVANAAVMGDGVIDGRGWAKWWDLAEQARRGGNQNCPRLIVLSHCDNFTLYRITLKNSPNFHVYYGAGNGFTAWGVTIKTPRTARNTDGINPGSSTNVTIAHCSIDTGDDHVAIKAGGHCSHMTIAHNRFYAGHGISIGSETYGGADSIRVTDLSIEGADNGIRIKSNSGRGGLVRDILYEDVRIRNTKNPILMDTDYAHFGRGGDKLPTFTDIILRNVQILTTGKITLQGYDTTHRLGIMFDNVRAVDPKIFATHADIFLGPGPVNFRPTGEDVKVSGTVHSITK